jgi:cation transporter-like permease
LSYTSQGSYVVTWTFDDGNGNTSVATQNVIVKDVTAPVVPTLADATGECSASVTAPSTSDNCSGTITATTNDPLSYSAQGTYVVTWTFDDGNGNTSVATQNVIVKDVTAPAIPTLADVTGECSASVTAPTTSDNCAGTITASTNDPLSYTSQGSYVVTWTFDDGNGNTSVATQNVIVKDVTAPAIPTLADVTGECSASVTAPTTSDNCAGTITASTNDPLSYTSQGSYVVTWTFDDGNGNTSVATQNVIVKDVTAPVIPTLADVTGECSASVTAPTTSDNCAGTITATTNDPLSYTSQGSYVVTWTFDDGNGNTSVATQNVIVKDVTAPVVPTLADVTGECSASVTAPTSDNCAGTITATTNDPLSYSAQGTYVVTWTFDDGNGNTSVATQNVIVKDVTAPVVPTLADATGECSASVTAPSTSDNCSGTITATTNDPLSYSAQGTYVVTWTFDDGNGNTSVATQNVIVKDVTAPAVPTLADATGECSASVTAPSLLLITVLEL